MHKILLHFALRLTHNFIIALCMKPAANCYLRECAEKFKQTNNAGKLIEEIYKYLICSFLAAIKLRGFNSIQHSNLITNSDSYL